LLREDLVKTGKGGRSFPNCTFPLTQRFRQTVNWGEEKGETSVTSGNLTGRGAERDRRAGLLLKRQFLERRRSKGY